MQQTSQLPPGLDTLPSELILSILAHLPPPHIALGNGSGPSQRNPLFAVQRTSKRLGAVCAPILWDRLEMDIGPGARGETSRVVAQLRAYRERALGCRKLRLESFDWAFLLPCVAEGERLLPDVEDVELYQTMPMSLDVVARFRKQRSLAVDYSELRPSPTHVTFAHLARMSLADVLIRLVPFQSSSFFDTSTLPSLRQLRLGFIYVERPSRSGDDGDAPVFSPSLVEQLDQVHLELSHASSLCADVLPLEALTPDAPVLWHAALAPGRATTRPAARRPPPGVHLAFLCVTLPRLSTFEEDDAEFDPVASLRALVAAHPYLRLALVPLSLWQREHGAGDGLSPELAPLVAEYTASGLALRPYDPQREREGFVPREAVQFWREEKEQEEVGRM
ncbi:hypothetical protein JCM3775_003706 [Rhodotorula graminis]